MSVSTALSSASLCQLGRTGQPNLAQAVKRRQDSYRVDSGCGVARGKVGTAGELFAYETETVVSDMVAAADCVTTNNFRIQ